MKTKLSFIACLLSLSGCMSTGVSTSSGVEAEYLGVNKMLEAKVAICGNLIPDEVVTQFAGVDQNATIKERKEKKQKALNSWKDKIDRISDYYKENSFYITIPANFKAFENKLLLTDASFWTEGATLSEKVQSAIPSKILINKVAPYQKNMLYPYAAIAPKVSDDERGWVDRDRRGIKVMAEYYGGKVEADSDVYVHNMLMSRGFSGPIRINIKGEYGGTDLGIPKSAQLLAFGANVNIFNWFERPDSIIKKGSDGFYVDTNNIENSDLYFREDGRDVDFDITYIYKLKGCTGNSLEGVATEVIVTPRSGNPLFDSASSSFKYLENS